MDVHLQFCGSWSSGSRDIRTAVFVTNERTNMAEAYGGRRNAFQAFRLKTDGVLFHRTACLVMADCAYASLIFISVL